MNVKNILLVLISAWFLYGNAAPAFAESASESVMIQKTIVPGIGRHLDEIQNVFARNESAITYIYNKLRKTDSEIGPGKIVVAFTIAPSGVVTECHLVSSSFSSRALNDAIVEKVTKLKFGPRDVPSFSYPNYPINFLPDRQY